MDSPRYRLRVAQGKITQPDKTRMPRSERLRLSIATPNCASLSLPR